MTSREVMEALDDVNEAYDGLMPVLRSLRKARARGVSEAALAPLLRQRFLLQDDVNQATARYCYLKRRQQEGLDELV